MQTVDKHIWDVAIEHENKGWQFEDQAAYFGHENGNLHGQIQTYAKHMNLFKDFGVKGATKNKLNYKEKIFDLKGKSVVDICGGPSSLLLRCFNFSKAVVVDPGNFPDYIVNRYKEAGIEVAKVPAELFVYEQPVDETWIYNALAHVYNPTAILLNAKSNSKTMRIIEGVNCGTNIQHPQNLLSEEFENVLGQKGKTIETNEPEPSPRGQHFVGVFHF